MSNNGEIKNLEKAVEHFLSIYLVDDLEWDVESKFENGINLLVINLSNSVDWDKNYEKLHHELVSYCHDWVKTNYKSLEEVAPIAQFTVKYKLPNDGDLNNDIAKNVRLLRLPNYYKNYIDLENSGKNSKVLSYLIEKKWGRKLLNIWYNLSYRYAILISIPVFLIVVFCLYSYQDNLLFQGRLKESYGYISSASGILSSFMLIFIINKISSIRSSKLLHTPDIRRLSNQFTYFRNICYNLRRDHVFWSKQNPYISSFNYAERIKDQINYTEYQFPDFQDETTMTKWEALYSKEESNYVISLVLQLIWFANEDFTRPRLSYTEYPPNHIYSLDELEIFLPFCEHNQIWLCATDSNLFPNVFSSSYHSKEIIKDINRIYPDKEPINELTKENLRDLSLDFQYHILPKLYKKAQYVESKLPIVIKYFIKTFTLLLSFGLIIPTILFQFTGTYLSYLSFFIAIGIIVHIILILPSILRSENWLRNDTDYLL